MIRHAEGVAGTWVNGVQAFDGKGMLSPEAGPGRVLDRLDA